VAQPPRTNQLERFLRWNFFGNVGAALFVFALWLLYPWWLALALACLVGLNAALVKSAERLAGRGDERRAALRFAAGAWVIALAAGVLVPSVFPAIVLVSFLPVSVIIPYGSRRDQQIAFAIGGAVAAALAAATLLPPILPLQTVSEGALRVVNVVFIPVVAALFCLSVFYGYERVRSAYEALRQSNLKLRESENSLENRVQERTTALELSQREVAQARDEAVAANAAKSRFLAAASHDLRQPIHALRLFAEALGDGEVPARVQGLANRIRDSADSLTTMFDELLDLSRLEAGAVEARPTEFPIGPLLEQLGAELAPDAEARGLELRVVRTGAIVRTDPLLLRRILQNLLVNALRYTEMGRVLIGCRRSGKQLCIEVWDTGPGIPESRRAEIFREFTQLDQARRSQGLGLGLAIVDKLARLLDCRIDMDSEVGRGTVFRVGVPLGAGAPSTRSSQPHQQTPGTLAGHFVAIVDEDMNVLEAMRVLLEGWGCELVLARSADEAVESLKLRGRAPEVILADYSLEMGRTGIEAIEQIRAATGARVPAVIITGETDPDVIARVRASGLPYLPKPIAPARLRAALTHMVRVG
jgi:signal transduction histidine kinase/CheY-like chemotaxis protein